MDAAEINAKLKPISSTMQRLRGFALAPEETARLAKAWREQTTDHQRGTGVEKERK